MLRLTQLWRAYNASAANGALNVPSVITLLGQAPLQAPSVFNFFSPSYAPPGAIANANLVAPELQIATEYQNTQITNYFLTIARCYVSVPVTGCAAPRPDTVILNTSEELALAGDAAALVDKIADRLFAEQISTTPRTQARALVERLPASSPATRVAEALYLIVTSPEFALQL